VPGDCKSGCPRRQAGGRAKANPLPPVRQHANGYAHIRLIFDGDRPVDFVYLGVNPAFEALTGLTAVVGKRVTEVIPGIRETDPELFETYGRVARTGVPERSETWVEALKEWFSLSVQPGTDRVVAVFISRRASGQALMTEQAMNCARWHAAAIGREGAFEPRRKSTTCSPVRQPPAIRACTDSGSNGPDILAIGDPDQLNS
jgi:hypothetical protein